MAEYIILDGCPIHKKGIYVDYMLCDLTIHHRTCRKCHRSRPEITTTVCKAEWEVCGSCHPNYCKTIKREAENKTPTVGVINIKEV